jgi:hypothetical protein
MNASLFSRLHGTSFAFGAAFACAAMLTLGASQSDGANATLQRVVSDPFPSSIVRIPEGTPYTVPPNTMLVLKSFASTATGGATSSRFLLKINDVLIVGGSIGVNGTAVTADLGFPIVAGAGEAVSIEEEFPGPDTVVALGYLSRP